MQGDGPRRPRRPASYLATGHQRHYSILYDNAVHTIQRGLLGEMHHIRAQWHRGNLPGNDSWQPPLPGDKVVATSKNRQREEASGRCQDEERRSVAVDRGAEHGDSGAASKPSSNDEDVNAEAYGYER